MMGVVVLFFSSTSSLAWRGVLTLSSCCLSCPLASIIKLSCDKQIMPPVISPSRLLSPGSHCSSLSPRTSLQEMLRKQTARLSGLLPFTRTTSAPAVNRVPPPPQLFVPEEDYPSLCSFVSGDLTSGCLSSVGDSSVVSSSTGSRSIPSPSPKMMMRKTAEGRRRSSIRPTLVKLRANNAQEIQMKRHGRWSAAATNNARARRSMLPPRLPLRASSIESEEM